MIIENQTEKAILDFLKENNITFKSEYIKLGVNKKGWEHKLYNVYLNKVRFEHRMGMNCTHEPTAVRVLHSLLNNGIALHYNFEDWCTNFNRDINSVIDICIYNECVEIGNNLNTIFGLDSNWQEILDYNDKTN